jgi:hypothetical protein
MCGRKCREDETVLAKQKKGYVFTGRTGHICRDCVAVLHNKELKEHLPEYKDKIKRRYGQDIMDRAIEATINTGKNLKKGL